MALKAGVEGVSLALEELLAGSAYAGAASATQPWDYDPQFEHASSSIYGPIVNRSRLERLIFDYLVEGWNIDPISFAKSDSAFQKRVVQSLLDGVTLGEINYLSRHEDLAIFRNFFEEKPDNVARVTRLLQSERDEFFFTPSGTQPSSAHSYGLRRRTQRLEDLDEKKAPPLQQALGRSIQDGRGAGAADRWTKTIAGRVLATSLAGLAITAPTVLALKTEQVEYRLPEPPSKECKGVRYANGVSSCDVDFIWRTALFYLATERRGWYPAGTTRKNIGTYVTEAYMDLLFEKTIADGRDIVMRWDKLLNVNNADLQRLVNDPAQLGYLIGTSGPIVNSATFGPFVSEVIPELDQTFTYQFFGQFYHDPFWPALGKPELDEKAVFNATRESGYDFLFALFLSQYGFYQQKKYGELVRSNLFKVFMAQHRSLFTTGGTIQEVLKALDSGDQINDLEESLESALLTALGSGTSPNVAEAVSFMCRSVSKFQSSFFMDLCQGREGPPKTKTKEWQWRTNSMYGGTTIPQDLPGWIKSIVKAPVTTTVDNTIEKPHRTVLPRGSDLRLIPFFNPVNPEKGLVWTNNLQIGVVLWSPGGSWRVVVLTPTQDKRDFETEIGYIAKAGSSEPATGTEKELQLLLRSATPLFVVESQEDMLPAIVDENPINVVQPVDWSRALISQARAVVNTALVGTFGFSAFFQKKANLKVRLAGCLFLLAANNPKFGQTVSAVTDGATEVILHISRQLNSTTVVESIVQMPEKIAAAGNQLKTSVGAAGLVVSGVMLAAGGTKKRKFADLVAPAAVGLGSVALMLL